MTRILLAEDDPAIRSYLSQMLTLEGYEVVAFEAGDLALQASERLRPDLAILDVMMPGADGFEVLRSIRASDSTRHVPVIMLTAKADNESTWEGWRSGCDSYIPKPFEPEALIANIERLLEQGNAA